MSLAAKSPADGYTIMSGYMAPITVNVSLGKLPYDPVKDLAPITLAALAQNVMTLHPGVPAGTVKEFIGILKAKPGQYNYASAGSGSSPHLTAELFKQMTQTSMNHVPYKGAGSRSHGRAARADIAGHANRERIGRDGFRVDPVVWIPRARENTCGRARSPAQRPDRRPRAADDQGPVTATGLRIVCELARGVR